MGYRGTREQLEARLASLSAELRALHEQLADASRRVDALREQEWGALGVAWFRFTLRRALRDVDASPRRSGSVKGGSVKGLTKAIERHERALTQGRDVLRWLDDSLAPDEEDAPSREAQPSPVAGPVRGVLGVIGAGARNVWAFAFPVLMVFGAVVALVAAIGGDADVDDFDADTDGLETGPAMAPDERHAADVVIGGVVLALGATLAAGGAGIWWWLR